MCCQRGNVLFLILIAVALFGALSYAVVKSSSGGGDASVEKAGLKAAQLIQYGDQVAYAVMKIRTIGGYSKSQVSFENNGTIVNPNCSEDTCRVFHPNGGGAHYWELSEDWRGRHGIWVPPWRWNFSKNNQFQDVGTNCAAASCNDVALLYRGIQREVCLEVNEQLGVGNPSGEPPESPGYTDPDYIGTMDYYSSSYVIGSTNSGAADYALNGHFTGCFYDPHASDDAYHFYRIIIDN